jgi:hypothetical protein
MVGRLVGSSSDGCEYCLVARISSYRCEELLNAVIAVDEAFSEARDICLCCVFRVVEHYRHAADIPREYLPPSPFIEFTDAPISD